MIGAAKFTSFYGNDVIPTTSFQTGIISENQNGDSQVKVNNSSGFFDITTDKIPVAITFSLDTSGEWSLSVFADVKELNDFTSASTTILSNNIIYVPQNKKLMVSMRANSLIPTGNAYGYFTLKNTLNDKSIANFTLALYNVIDV
jgi:hypothetical protein